MLKILRLLKINYPNEHFLLPNGIRREQESFLSEFLKCEVIYTIYILTSLLLLSQRFGVQLPGFHQVYIDLEVKYRLRFLFSSYVTKI